VLLTHVEIALCRKEVSSWSREIAACTASRLSPLIADYTIIRCSCVTFVAILNWSTDLVGSRTSNGCSAEIPHIAHANLRAYVLPFAYRLTSTTYVRLRRPIRSINDAKGRRRLNLGAEGVICRATRAITPDYIKDT